jgi:lipopolysaccharide transport system ATP-binding protein
MKAIEFENIGKQYRLGLVSSGTISHDLNRWWTINVLHKEDPYLRIGETNDRSHKGHSDYVWALKDINFSVEEGDVVGIIGKNGAGKSTLLKLLSRVTVPTTGKITARGRIASLLEVGTGFHPEMTGRENIYMNGAIMGMTKAEITRKLDEIVDFSGCERYIDTPVKRYSSGMTVRLGFAIAAHLEPEILVVDEVLAVGDAEFQKKAIGKMQDVSKGEGRSVLFVSHNMAAVRSLCTKGIVLNNGMINYIGTCNNAIDEYLHSGSGMKDKRIKDNIQWIKPGLTIQSIEINDTDNVLSTIHSGQERLPIRIIGHCDNDMNSEISMIFRNEDEVALASFPFCDESGNLYHLNGDFEIKTVIKLPKTLYRGILKVDMYFHLPNVEFQIKAPGCCQLDCEGFLYKFGQTITQKRSGLLQLESGN